VQAIWDALTSALTTVGSIGKRIADYLTGDAFARLGAPNGVSISADIQTRGTSTYAGADTAGTATLLARVPALVPVASDYTSVRAAKLDNLDTNINSRLAATDYTAPDNADVVTALSDLVTLLARNTPLDAAGVRTALGLAAANLDTQLGEIATDTDTILTNIATVLTTAMTESYAADGATMTPAQAFYEIRALLSEFAISGTTLTLKKKDGVTTAATYTLNDPASPTAITRAT